MNSPVQVCNKALVRIGAQTITSMTESSEQARKCNEIYEDARDEVLGMHPWNFAIKRVALAEVSSYSSLDSEYDKAFQRPSDCIRPLKINDDEYESWNEEGEYILTNASTPILKYISRIETESKFSPAFNKAFVYYLASELAYCLTHDLNVASKMEAKMVAQIKNAKSEDGQSGSPTQPIQDEWTDSRWGGLGTTTDLVNE